MTRFTLDAKCLIELDGNGTAAKDVAALVEAARQGQADVAIVASSSSRYHPGGARLARFSDFKKQMAEVGLGSLSLLRPKAKHGFTYHGFGVLGMGPRWSVSA
ncbi:hypothetical protein PWG15_33435 (plasmid) [Ensifer adhaerens]|uniref:hypothetical protein n=1 Tax=Ensifer adhaerens TaxID=106592 RepID=UPI0023A9A396|nr:hypothetical protein [Ensifer adhaerens]WDZ81815.1 hypothetical protein PWG15_33435 [Ensifer adhaerens]